MIKLNLNAEEILDKVFKTSRNGYDPLDVDMFLDTILHDYKNMESNVVISQKELNEMKTKISDYESRIKKLEIENTSFKGRLSNIKDGDNVTKDNVELIKRINMLEKFIFEKGFDPSKIK